MLDTDFEEELCRPDISYGERNDDDDDDNDDDDDDGLQAAIYDVIHTG